MRWEGGGGGRLTPCEGVWFSLSPPPGLETSEGLSVLLGFLPEVEWALPGDRAGASIFPLSLSPFFLFKKPSESLRGVQILWTPPNGRGGGRVYGSPSSKGLGHKEQLCLPAVSLSEKTPGPAIVHPQ